MKPAYSIDFILERTKIMIEISNLSEYIKEFQFEEKQLKAHPLIKNYIENQVQKLKELIEALTSANFWIDIPIIMGIDSKLVLLREVIITIEDFDFSDEEVLKIVEQDYPYYNKELCGYKLNDVTSHSLIFKIK